jgi:hypothetical protein
MGVCQLVDLGVHGGQHFGVAVAQRGDGRTTAGIEIAAALLVAQRNAAGTDRHRRRTAQIPV